jgi:hypothetical protein
MQFGVTNRHTALSQHPLLADVAANSLQVGAVMTSCGLRASVSHTPPSLMS